jgi:predicted metal-binding protein
MRGSHTSENEHSGSWLEHRKAFHWEIRKGSLGESLSCPPSVADLDEHRLSMVLELYYRKSGRKTEGKERERKIGKAREKESMRWERKTKREERVVREERRQKEEWGVRER